MRVLVTGSSGHLGDGLMRVLAAEGHEAIGLDRLPGPHTQAVADLGDRDTVRRCVSEVEVVLHAATLHKPHVATHSSTRCCARVGSTSRAMWSARRPRSPRPTAPRCAALRRDAAAVIERRVPGAGAVYAARGWTLPATLGRVYDSARARAALGWRPRYDFARILGQLARGEPLGSPLARAVGRKGYHAAAPASAGSATAAD